MTHERTEPCDCIEKDSCYWDGYGTATGHRGAVGAPGITLEEWVARQAMPYAHVEPVTLILVPWRDGTLYIARWDSPRLPVNSIGGPCWFTTAFNSRELALDKLKHLMIRELGRAFQWDITTQVEA